MNDRELLKFAAKAAGITYGVDGFITGTNRNKFNPLTDDGDAFRLAVQLGLDVDCSSSHQVSVFALRQELDAISEDGNDRQQATRRAITRAAAAIGGAK